MILHAINCKNLANCTFDEVVEGLTEHWFLRFMSHGRDGVVAGSQDVIDTLYQFALDHIDQGQHVNDAAKKTMTDRASQSFKNHMIRQFMDTIITKGTNGIRGVIHLNYIVAVEIVRTGKF
jgi:hypothetical protein